MLGSLVAFLNNKDVQQFLVNKTTKLLSDKLHTKVEIAEVSFELFNKLTLKKVYIADQKGDTLLFANKLNLGIHPLYLLDKQIVCTTLSITDFRAKLVVDKQNKFNLKFFLDALQQKDSSKMTLSFQIDDIKLKQAKISFDNQNFEQKAKGFDAKHILLSDINAQIKLEKFNSNTLLAAIKSLNFKEQSGFELKNLALAIKANTETANITDLEINLPNSEIAFSPISAQYDSLANLKSFEKIKFNFKLKQSKIKLNDLKPFIPELERARGNIKLSADFHGSLSNLRIKKLNFAYNNDLYLNGDFEFSGLPKLNETFIYAKLNEVKTDKTKLQDLLSSIAGRPLVLPDKLNRLGTIRYKGNISGFTSNLVAYGTWRSNIGKINSDLMLEVMPDFKGLSYSGSIKSKDLKIGKLLNDSSDLGNVSFDFSSKGSILPQGKVDGDIQGTISSLSYRNYNYKNIQIKGDFDKHTFDGQVDFDDDNAKLNFTGGLSFENDLPSGRFSLDVDKFNPYRLNLASKNSDIRIAFKAKADFSGKDLTKTNTNLLIDSLNIANDKSEVFVRRIHIKSRIGDTISVLTLNSGLVKGELRGQYNLLSLGGNIKDLLHSYLPSTIAKTTKNNASNTNSINNFVFNFSDFNVNEIAEVLNLDMELAPETSVSGYYNNTNKKVRLEFISPMLRWKTRTFTDAYIICNNPSYALQLSTNASINKTMKVSLDTRMADDSLIVALAWDKPKFFSGKLNFLNRFSRDSKNNLQADIDLYPTQIWLKNIPWDLNKSKMHTDFKKIYVQNFVFKHEDLFVTINGVASKEMADGLDVEMNKVPLTSIIEMVNVNAIKLDGEITGNATLTSVFDKFILSIDAYTKDFSFNNATWGDVKVKSAWDNNRKRLTAKCIAFTPSDTIIRMNGEYFPKNDSLGFYADVKDLNIRFLRRYLNGALQNVDGTASGKVHLFGGLKNFLLEGDIAVKEGRFNIDFLKTAYHFSDTIHIRSNSLRFNNIKVYDAENNSGQVNGWITHNVFKNMKFNFDIDCNKILAINTKKEDNEQFYGKAYGSGRVRIAGDGTKVDFNIRAKTDAGTKIYIPMVTSAVATENTFIKFKQKPDPQKELFLKRKDRTSETTSKTRITLKLQLEATPDAEVQLIVDQTGGDMVRASGNGNLRIEYDNFETMKLYGNFEVEKGEYVFTLQQVVRKNFGIRRGGSIRWSGNPYMAIINLDAFYTIPSVSLLDILDETQLETVARTSVPVNCLLNLTGDLMQPNIKFDIEVPSDQETQRRIKNIVNTEEMMNREMLALLVMNRFYKPDYLQNSRSGLGLDMASILTTTVSGQLNNWLAQLSNKVNVGVNARLGNGQNFSEGGEYEVALMYQPNNRLVISSNVGYRNDLLNTTGTNFIGDVDAEYKLTKSGKLRAKAYSHSADNYYFNTSGNAKTTQGVGFIYREDFNSFRDLMKNYFKINEEKNDSNTVDKKSLNLNK